MSKVLLTASLKNLNEATGYSVRYLSRIRNQKRRLTPPVAVAVSEAFDDPKVLIDCCAMCPVGCQLQKMKNPASGKSGTTKPA